MHLWPLREVYSAIQDPLARFELGCNKRRKEKGKTDGMEKERKKGTKGQENTPK